MPVRRMATGKLCFPHSRNLRVGCAEALVSAAGRRVLSSVGSLEGAGTMGLLIPPSIFMIVYGVSADVSIVGLS